MPEESAEGAEFAAASEKAAPSEGAAALGTEADAPERASPGAEAPSAPPSWLAAWAPTLSGDRFAKASCLFRLVFMNESIIRYTSTAMIPTTMATSISTRVSTSASTATISAKVTIGCANRAAQPMAASHL